MTQQENQKMTKSQKALKALIEETSKEPLETCGWFRRKMEEAKKKKETPTEK